MRQEKGVTLSSLIVYVIGMSIIIASVATLTKYFYSNINTLTTRTNASKEFTSFNSYFINETNTRGIKVYTNLLNTQDNSIIVFSDGNQFKFAGNAIYLNKIKICKDVNSCEFIYNENTNKITVNLRISNKNFNNEYALQNDV